MKLSGNFHRILGTVQRASDVKRIEQAPYGENQQREEQAFFEQQDDIIKLLE
ncbi:MAG: hypothetical protein AAF050_10345 [Cyanobacteria bacterium J06649_5]